MTSYILFLLLRHLSVQKKATPFNVIHSLIRQLCVKLLETFYGIQITPRLPVVTKGNHPHSFVEGNVAPNSTTLIGPYSGSRMLPKVDGVFLIQKSQKTSSKLSANCELSCSHRNTRLRFGAVILLLVSGKAIRPVKYWVKILSVHVWLELCTSYRSSSHHFHLHHLLPQQIGMVWYSAAGCQRVVVRYWQYNTVVFVTVVVHTQANANEACRVTSLAEAVYCLQLRHNCRLITT